MIKKFFAELMKPKAFDSNRYFGLIVRRTNLVLLGVIGVLSICITILSLQISNLNTLENVYIVGPDQTLVARRSDETLSRSEYEVTAFSRLFLEKVFANNRYSFEENLREITEWMDKKSSALLLAEMGDDQIEALYREANAISTVFLEHIDIDNRIPPYKVTLTYKHFLHFLNSGKSVYEDEELNGKVYFELNILKRSRKNEYGLQIQNLKFEESDLQERDSK